VPRFASVIIKIMKPGNSISFLRPRLLNVFLTFLVLCIPLLREQYNNGQFVSWYRPIDIIISSLTQRESAQLFLPMLFLTVIVYLFISILILVVSKLVKK
jgi:hypothetical protein